MNIILYVIIIFIIEYCSCLRNVRVIFPKSVPDGGIAALYCFYELENEPLYSVKWYRGNYEIYRYIPKEYPKIRVFPLPGLYIDLNSSNSHRLTLLDVPKYLGGNFTCEVSADEPNYSTQYVTEFLHVTQRNETQFLIEDENMPNERYTKLSSSNEENKYLNFTSIACNVSFKYTVLRMFVYLVVIIKYL